MLWTTVAALIVLIALSLPIAVVLGALGLLLDEVYAPFPLNVMLGDIFWDHGTNFVLVAIPVFVMMGEIILRAGIADRMYAATAQWLSWLPGGLMHANIGASALFAATSGSSVATAATIATTALPQQASQGYDERLFLGSVAAGGTLGILIPPSMNMIVFGFLTNTSIPQLFIGGIIPGLLLAGLYMAVIGGACMLRPARGGRPVATSWRSRIAALPDLVPPLLLLGVVIGSIYAGLATPTEAAALGVVASLVLAAVAGRLSLPMMRAVLLNTIRTSGMVMLILTVAFFLNFVIASLGMVQAVNDAILGLDWTPLATLAIIVVAYLVMGMFLETLAMVVLTVPVIAPMIEGLGFDLVWFGVLIVVLCEAAVLTPPVGMLCFVVQGVRGRGELNDVFVGVLPFLGALAVMLGLLIAFPEIVLWLPTLAFRS